MSAKVGPAGSIEPTEMAAYGAQLPVRQSPRRGNSCERFPAEEFTKRSIG